MRDRVIAEFAESPIDAHDPISIDFLAPSSALRKDIEAMNPDGTNMSERLAMSWDALRWSPIDDTPGESPHARLKHVEANHKASSWAFQVSTERLKQNLSDIQNIMPIITPPVDAQFLWG